jgi:hypothetical protein
VVLVAASADASHYRLSLFVCQAEICAVATCSWQLLNSGWLAAPILLI